MTKTELDNAVTARLAQIETALDPLSDEQAVELTTLFPLWEVGVSYAVGDRRQYDDRLYKCRQVHTSQADWTPDKTPALWEEIPQPGQGDTPSNPIPYNNNMALVVDKYYSQYGVLYVCIRSTGIAVYNDLADLVGLYVQVYG